MIKNKFNPLQKVEIPNHVEVFVVVTNNPVLSDDIIVESNDTVANFPLYGCAKNKGGWLSDDFDAPLEEMEI
jgi:hypothetical protein